MFVFFLLNRFDVDWDSTWTRLSTSNIYLYAVGLASYYFGFILRGLRWRIILDNAASADEGLRENGPSVAICSRYILLGWFANAVTLFRLGDAYRAYVMTRRTVYTFPMVMGTVLAERVLDLVMVFALLLIAAMFFYGTYSGTGILLIIALATFLMLAALISLLAVRQVGPKLAKFLPNKLRFSYDRFHEGLLNSFKRLPVLFVITFLTWLTEVGRLYFVMQSLGLSSDVTPAVILFVTLANAILTTIPITPGGLGIVEPGLVGLLSISMGTDDAVSVAILDRSISYLSIVFFGGIVFLLNQIDLRDIRDLKESNTHE